MLRPSGSWYKISENLSMAQINLKRIITQVLPVLNSLSGAIGAPIRIQTTEGKLLLGDAEMELPRGKYAIELAGEVIAWVEGAAVVEPIASLLTYLVEREVEKKSLANEVLERYREINLLYNMADKLAACLELQTVVKTAIEEAHRLLKSTSASIMLWDDTRKLRTIATTGEEYQTGTIELGQGIIGNIAALGRAELINNVQRDPRFTATDLPVSSLICVPLKAKEQVIGIINISHTSPVFYTAGELKLLVAVASQVAPAIENALLYEKSVEEAKAREANLQQQVLLLQVEVDQAKRERQVAEITETDYFQQLQRRARDLRKKP